MACTPTAMTELSGPARKPKRAIALFAEGEGRGFLTGQQSRRITAVFSAVFFLSATALVHGAEAARKLCYGEPATKVGTSGSDTLRGTPKADVIVARGGSDVVRAGRGKDRICGGKGNDKLSGGGSGITCRTPQIQTGSAVELVTTSCLAVQAETD
jgi:Ca2+-binding RTX toxin-like protein